MKKVFLIIALLVINFATSQSIANRLLASLSTQTDTSSPALVTVANNPPSGSPFLSSVAKTLLTWDIDQVNDLQDSLDVKALKTEIPNVYSWALNSTKPTYDTSEVTEVTNLYFTNTRARSAISLTTTGSGSATYNNTTGVLNIPTPTIPTVVQQYGTTYTKEWNGKSTTSASTNEYTFNISGASFSSITNIQATGYYSGAASTTQPLVSVKSYSTTSVTLIIAESANTNVLIGGTVEGLTDFLKVGEVFLTVKGN